ncbi:hypothetical protein FACS1894104_3860 [Actinomycetota bacterium]|nr:hypothetical protein FACS1894104_3860 [Actinomycetota bacterium]
MSAKDKDASPARSCRFNIRLTQAEADVLDARAKAAHMTKTAFITSLISDSNKRFINIDKTELAKVKRELAAQGNNLNQAIRAINASLISEDYDEQQQMMHVGLSIIINENNERLAAYHDFSEFISRVGR